jgi:hypothetical protein
MAWYTVSNPLFWHLFTGTYEKGTRWLSRWDKELDIAVKLCYYGLTTGRGARTSFARQFTC